MFHHLLAKDYTKIALADLSGIKQMIDSKPAAQMWAYVSTIRTLYHAAIWLVIPLPENGGKVYKRMKRGC